MVFLPVFTLSHIILVLLKLKLWGGKIKGAVCHEFELKLNEMK